MSKSSQWKQRAARLALPPDVSRVPVSANEWMTQIGTGKKFQEAPRWARGERDVSTTLGRRDVAYAVHAAFRRETKKKDSVRHFHEADLRAAEYEPTHTPTPNDPQHTSIWGTCDNGIHDIARIWWESPLRVTLAQVALNAEGRQGGEVGEVVP